VASKLAGKKRPRAAAGPRGLGAAEEALQATRRPSKSIRKAVLGAGSSMVALPPRPLSISERIARVDDLALRALLTDGSLTRGQVATLLQSVEDV
jgi:hypothetical protein